MRNLLLIENNETNPFPANDLISSDYRVRKINDIYSLILHFKEFNPDIIVLNLATVTDLILTELNNLSSQTVPVIIYTEECSSNRISQLINAEVSFLSLNGSSCSSINNHIDIAFARFNHLQKLKTALEEARTQLEDRKQIDRAKAILIKTRNFSEDEAYHTLRKLAMGRNITLGEMARNVIAMADLLK
jgi:two-component system, response regulator / RNA-binding antiterminator